MNLVFDLDCEPTAPAQARQAIRALTDKVAPELVEDLRLLITELVTNSVRHGPGGKIRVSIRVDHPTRVFADVTDGGATGAVEIRESAEDGGGLGLRIVDRISARWGVYEGSTNVWFELRADDA